jgi:hypothetical protein
LGLAGVILERYALVFRFSHWRMDLFAIKEIGLAEDCLAWHVHFYPVSVGFVCMVYDFVCTTGE